MHGEEMTHDDEFELLRVLRRRRDHHIGRVHEAVRRRVMLVEADAVETQALHLLPRLDMLGIVPLRELWIEILAGQRVGEVLEFVEMMAVRHEVEQKYFHEVLSFICGYREKGEG